MSSKLSFTVNFLPGETKSVLADLEKPFHIVKVDYDTNGLGVYVTELWQGNKKLFLPWKQPLSRLSMLVGTTLDSGIKYLLKFVNESTEKRTLTITLTGK